MARVPTLAEEDAKRPNRECECLVRERTRIVNRMKGTLARLGIRDFKPTLRKATERLAILHTPEGPPLPANVSAELQRDLARLEFVVGQIKQIEKARQKRLEQPESESGPQARRQAQCGYHPQTARLLDPDPGAEVFCQGTQAAQLVTLLCDRPDRVLPQLHLQAPLPHPQAI